MPKGIVLNATKSTSGNSGFLSAFFNNHSLGTKKGQKQITKNANYLIY